MIALLIHTLFRLYYILIFVRIIMSWFPVDQYSEWVRILKKLTDPYLDIFRKIIPPIGMIDISPIIALFVLNLIENILFRLMLSIGI